MKHNVVLTLAACAFGIASWAVPVGAQTGPTTSILSSVASPSTSGPGSLASSSRLATAPAGSVGFALRYRSVSPAGAPIEVTGVAFVPDRPAPAKGWPTLSFAHGTVGLADRCAPSKNVSQIETILAATFNALGIAVVQSDYEGIGTEGRHPYLVGVSEGRGVIDAVRALRNVAGQTISNRYVVWGHSQGGHAALFAGQIAPTWAPELKLLGVVAGAPPSQLGTVQTSLTTSPFRGYLLMVAAGMQAAVPSLDLTRVLTPKGVEILPIVDSACNAGVFKEVNKYPFADLVNIDGLKDPAWANSLAANEPGTVKIKAPVLIVHGDIDEQIPVATSATLMATMCRKGTVVTRKVYPGADHAGAALVSLFDVSSWLKDRIDGRPAKNGCRGT
jgi:pimeloyl-ACP methyl ester carboxylesterase